MAQEMVQVLDVGAVRAQTHDFILKQFLWDGSDTDIDDDASLLETGVVDATGVLELVLYVEDTYGIHVADGDLIPENFDSVNNIARYVMLQLANM
jgi:acyl carrier protein